MTDRKLPRIVYNRTTIVGFYLAAFTGIFMLISLMAMSRLEHSNPYAGIFVYMVLPPFVVLGVLLIIVGMVRQWRGIRRGEMVEQLRWPHVNLNNPTHQRIFILFLLGGLFLTSLSAFGGYQAYHYTESVQFCGTTCHTVMKPEYVAYHNSPHARVACAECHVGEGASWYAKSKLSGAYQVYATARNIYPRPIPTPIKNLRPAQETCEQCHWPEKFYGAQQRQFNHYMYDEENTSWPINMLIKTGGGDPHTGQTAGIHWHMNIGVDVMYIPRDEKRQDIPWIRVHDKVTDRVTIYQDTKKPLTEEEIAAAEKRKMDCMDCHNRPSHKYRSPDYMIDLAILTGRIDRTLPDIKRIATEAMLDDYDTEEDAMRLIPTKILKAYSEDYPDVFAKRRLDIDAAVLATQEQFKNSIFPEMKVKWEFYPDNIGHFIYPGCMRCHDGNKKSEEGWVLSRDCTSCHAILSQGSGDRMQLADTAEGLEFVHPIDIGEEWRETGCYECHTGTQP